MSIKTSDNHVFLLWKDVYKDSDNHVLFFGRMSINVFFVGRMSIKTIMSSFFGRMSKTMIIMFLLWKDVHKDKGFFGRMSIKTSDKQCFSSLEGCL